MVHRPNVDVTVIVTAWRDAPLLTECLRALRAHRTRHAVQVIVAVNEPSDDCRARLRATPGADRMLLFDVNLGFGGATNRASAEATGRYLVLLNDDCVVQDGWLDALVELAERRPDCGIVGSALLHPDGVLQEAGSVIWADGSTAAVAEHAPAESLLFERRVDYCSAASILVRRDLWDELHGFDESFHPAYYEDVDLCLRAARAGRQTWVNPASLVRHQRSASSSETLREFLFARGRRHFVARWGELLAERPAPGQVEAAMWQAMGRPMRVLVIDDALPGQLVGSGFGRMRDMLEVLCGQDGMHVTLHPRIGTVDAIGPAGRMGLRVVFDLEAHLAVPGVGYDVVVVSRPHNAEIYETLLREALPGVPVVYDAEAIYYRRIELQARIAHPEQRARLQDDARRMAEVEARAVRSAQAVVCICEPEAAVVRRWTDAPVHVVEPWLAEPRPTRAGFADRAHVEFVAGWSGGPDAPNADALRWLLREVMPKVLAEFPWCRLLVTGGEPPADLARVCGPHVEFVGVVPQLADFYERIRVAVSPTRFGAGVKLKSVEAIQYGVPLVASSEAAEGLPEVLRDTIWVCDDPADFAQALIGFLGDRAAWGRQRAAQLRALAAIDPAGGVARWPEIIRTVADTAGGGQSGRMP